MDLNLTFWTVLYIVFLIIPGVFFKRFYFQGHFNKQFQSGLYADRLITSLFWGAIIQVITIHILIQTSDLNFGSFSEILKEAYSSIYSKSLPNGISSLFTFASMYLVWSVFIGILLGHLSHQLVRKTKLDLNYAVFRFSNKWYYYFTGEILNTHEFKFKKSKNGKVSSSIVDVLVDYGEGENVLFTGTLTQYSLCSNGDLETLYLTGTGRYKKPEGQSPYVKQIPGDCFIIPYNRVLNMNIDYVIETSEEVKVGRLKRFVLSLMSVLFILLLLVVFVFPWFTEAGLLKKVISTFIFLLAWLFLMVSYAGLVSKQNNLSPRAILISFLISVLFSLFGALILGILDISFLW